MSDINMKIMAKKKNMYKDNIKRNCKLPNYHKKKRKTTSLKSLKVYYQSKSRYMMKWLFNLCFKDTSQSSNLDKEF